MTREGLELSLVVQVVKNHPAVQGTWVQSLGGKIPWRREWLSSPVFLPGESHGQRSLAYFIYTCIYTHRVSLLAQTVKNPPAIQETWVQSLGQDESLEKGMAIHSSILSWRIPCAEESGGL